MDTGTTTSSSEEGSEDEADMHEEGSSDILHIAPRSELSILDGILEAVLSEGTLASVAEREHVLWDLNTCIAKIKSSLGARSLTGEAGPAHQQSEDNRQFAMPRLAGIPGQIAELQSRINAKMLANQAEEANRRLRPFIGPLQPQRDREADPNDG